MRASEVILPLLPLLLLRDISSSDAERVPAEHIAYTAAIFGSWIDPRGKKEGRLFETLTSSLPSPPPVPLALRPPLALKHLATILGRSESPTSSQQSFSNQNSSVSSPTSREETQTRTKGKARLSQLTKGTKIAAEGRA